MLIYIEKKAENYEITKDIIKRFSDAQILWIDHYKNIFDKKIGNQKLTPAIIIAILLTFFFMFTPFIYYFR